jgi:hypothetical protein
MTYLVNLDPIGIDISNIVTLAKNDNEQVSAIGIALLKFLSKLSNCDFVVEANKVLDSLQNKLKGQDKSDENKTGNTQHKALSKENSSDSISDLLISKAVESLGTLQARTDTFCQLLT